MYLLGRRCLAGWGLDGSLDRSKTTPEELKKMANGGGEVA